jgi:APA family basic amino acid/polyamine antiporter
LPSFFAHLGKHRSPSFAILAVGLATAGLVLIGNVETTWAFSAFTVLVYYAITNLAALRLPKSERLFSPLVAVAGLVGCAFLAFWVPRTIWLAGLALIAGGLFWHLFIRRLWAGRPASGA